MILIEKIELKKNSQEELLPGFSEEFPYIATCANLDNYIEDIVPWHWHGAVELFYIESGCLEYITPNGKWTFDAGSGGFVNANILHSSRIVQKEVSNIQHLHLFDPILICGEHGNRMEQKYIRPFVTANEIEVIPLCPSDSEQSEVIQQIRQAFDLSESEWGYEFKVREILTSIWMKLFELAKPLMKNNRGSDSSNEQIKIMMSYVQECYSQHISVDCLAKEAHISKRACFRLFQDKLHMTPVEYMQMYRLQKACRMLAKSDEPVTNIAGCCGLGSSSYFGKVFREKFGCTPLQYRRKWRDCDILMRE